MKNFWKFSWLIAFALLIITVLSSTFVYFRNAFGRDLSNLWDIVVLSNFEIILIFILGLVISLVLFFVDRYALDKKWKFKRILELVIIISMLLYSIKPIRLLILTRQVKNHCVTIDPKDRIIYQSDKANVYLTKSTLLDKLESRLVHFYDDTSLYYNYKPELNLKQYLENKSSLTDFVIKDTFYYLPDTFQLHSTFKDTWTYDTIPVIDESDIRNDFSKAMYNLLDDILIGSEISVFNNESKQMEKFIYSRKWYHPLGSEGIDFYFPNDSVFIERVLRWGM